ncbi:hypothetical protein VB776_16250 [Arcicella sp. DC2W]|uniref:Uncharacterized protein n=1 Tax=Arcicella gelida TaxID=2984195 RepID=A0ABU5S7L8_9BACT|nr:hypothetical protein [Arcicella sp. DC2W]MEA5404485.1 hypothetical protein [Arcicella sp. DC2W]
MAITINKVNESELKEEFPTLIDPVTKNPFQTVKHYVEYIVNNRHKQTTIQATLPEINFAQETELLQKRLNHATNKAVKAGVNRASLLKELSQIQ